MSEFTLHHGNCLDILKTLPPDSIDSVVTDPPYGLKFMGRKWDYDVPAVEVWAECLRVLKPGGHLLAFAGTRTQHRMAVRIEDAGFEIRDLIMWHYSTGFPKSLNIGCKCSGNNIPYTHEQGASQIPKCDVRSMRFGDVSEAVNNPEKRGQVLLQSVQESGAPEHRAEGADSSTAGGKESVLEGGKLSGAGQGISVGENAGAPEGEAERIRVGAHSGCGEEAWTRPASGGGGSPREQEQIGQSTGESDGVRRPQFALGDEPSTGRYRCEKCQGLKGWNGWGTALKPATEIVTVARKPLIGTVAENVLEHGTGALNIDACRVPVDPVADASQLRTMNRSKRESNQNEQSWGMSTVSGDTPQVIRPEGRWPANLIHDGSEEVLEAFPQAPGQLAKAAEGGDRRKDQNVYGAMTRGSNGSEPRQDGGSAARFFYCSKSSKSDRGEGNTHNTVKPTNLMRYLCRLVTPVGGVVLDPFMGSGSTGKAATIEGFRFIGIELDQAFVEIAKTRISFATAETT